MKFDSEQRLKIKQSNLGLGFMTKAALDSLPGSLGFMIFETVLLLISVSVDLEDV